MARKFIGGPCDGVVAEDGRYTVDDLCMILSTTKETGNYAHCRFDGENYVYVSMYNKADLEKIDE
jgi:hypothetical protein